MNYLDQRVLSPTAPPDRRQYPRHAVKVPIELRQDGSDVPMRLDTSDLSHGGCYLELMMTLPIGTCVNATLWLDNSPVRVRGRVVTQHPQFGNGIMFVKFEGEGEKVLTNYLDPLPL